MTLKLLDHTCAHLKCTAITCCLDLCSEYNARGIDSLVEWDLNLILCPLTLGTEAVLVAFWGLGQWQQ